MGDFEQGRGPGATSGEYQRAAAEVRDAASVRAAEQDFRTRLQFRQLLRKNADGADDDAALGGREDCERLLAHAGQAEEEELPGEVAVAVVLGQAIENQFEERGRIVHPGFDARRRVIHGETRLARALAGRAGRKVPYVVAHLRAVETSERAADAEQVGSGLGVLAHVLGRRDAAHPDDHRPRPDRGADLLDRAQAHGTDTVSREPAHLVVEDGLVAHVGHGRADGVGHGDAGGARGQRGPGGFAQVGKNGGQLHEHGDGNRTGDGSGDALQKLGVLADLGAVALGVRAGHVQLEAVGDGGQGAGCGQEALRVGTEDGDQQELVVRDPDAVELGQELFRARIGQADRVDVATGGIAGVDGLTVSGARLEADALGGDDADLGDLLETFPDGGGVRAANAGGDQEAAANRLAPELVWLFEHVERR